MKYESNKESIRMDEQTRDNNNASYIENDDAVVLMIKLFILLLLSSARGFSRFSNIS